MGTRLPTVALRSLLNTGTEQRGHPTLALRGALLTESHAPLLQTVGLSALGEEPSPNTGTGQGGQSLAHLAPATPTTLCPALRALQDATAGQSATSKTPAAIATRPSLNTGMVQRGQLSLHRVFPDKLVVPQRTTASMVLRVVQRPIAGPSALFNLANLQIKPSLNTGTVQHGQSSARSRLAPTTSVA
jgi:hypothetical protein